MISTLLRRTAAVAAVAALGATSLAATPIALSAQAGGIAVGTAAPANFAVTALDGTTVDLAQLIGKQPVIMEFWATWCPLCRKLEPAFKAAKEKYGAQIAFVNVGVPENQSMERQKAYVTERALAGLFVFDADSRVIKAYQVPHTSYVVVVDKAGTVVYTGVGGDQYIDAAIRKALGTQ
ncbi:TlpA family protein disulfide reductase [Gemmatimonas sp.]